MENWAIGAMETIKEFGSEVEAIRLTWTKLGVSHSVKFSELSQSLQDSMIKWINEK